MDNNVLPYYDDSINTTGCCLKFNPDALNEQEQHFDNKPFIRATTKSLFNIPLNMSPVFQRVHQH